MYITKNSILTVLFINFYVTTQIVVIINQHFSNILTKDPYGRTQLFHWFLIT